MTTFLRKHLGNLALVAMTVGSLTFLLGTSYVNAHRHTERPAAPGIELLSKCVIQVSHYTGNNHANQTLQVLHPCSGESMRISGSCGAVWEYGATVSALGTRSTITCPRAAWSPKQVYSQYKINGAWYSNSPPSYST